MTRCYLVFSYAELSKFVQLQGKVHLAAAEHVLQYLRGTLKEGLVYSNPGAVWRNQLQGWVDSDYVLDPDTSKSVTGYVLSLNNAPVSWKAKRQDCVTLSSAEAEYVAASMCGQEEVHTSHRRASILRARHGSLRVDDAGEVCRNAQRGRCAHEEPPRPIAPASLPVPYGHTPGVQGVLHGHRLHDARGCGCRCCLRDSLKSFSLSGGEAPADTLHTRAESGESCHVRSRG
eukprot:3917865-Rhodomonas_salina.2